MASSDSDLELAQQQRIFNDYNRFLDTTTLAMCVLAPVLIAVPPRKIDLFTFTLSGAFLASVDYQVKQRTSLGIMGHTMRPFMSRAPPTQYGQESASPAWEPRRLLEEKSSELSMEAGGKSKLQQIVQEDWKQQRLKEEQEKLDEGEGYWTMITDQVWQVWNQEGKKVEQLKEKDEEVVQAREEKG